jgi:DNA-binding MarR family transcriptional regulator
MDLGIQFKKINDVMKKRFNRELEKIGLTFSQHRVLLYLSGCEKEEAPLKMIEKEAGVAQSTMAGIVMRLEDKGYVESFTDGEDRRIKKVRLSKTGRKICRKAYDDFRKNNEEMCSRLSESEVKELERLLAKVYAGLCENDSEKEVHE